MQDELPFRPLVIRASAGTGKTYRLTNRLIALLAEGEKPDRILATTFTKKAASEIQDRLFLRLAEAALDPDKARELSSAAGCRELSAKTSLEILNRVVSQQHRLSVCTLDSFFIRIAKSFSFELGLPPIWRIVDEASDRRLKEEAVSEVISGGPRDLLLGLISLLWRGRVRRSVHREISETADSLYALFLESEPEAWRWLEPQEGLNDDELRRALSELEEAELPLTKQGKPSKQWSNARTADLESVRSKDWEGFLKGGLAKAVLSGSCSYYKTPLPEPLLAAYVRLVNHASSVIINRIREETLAAFEIVRLFAAALQRKKLSSGNLNFADVKHLLSRASLSSELNELYFRLDSRICHLLLDEFQDTSVDEWQVLEPIADEILSKSGIDRSFFCVGDVKQAIYGWRGGVSEVFDTLTTRHRVLHEETMEKSFRSSPAVIEFVNRTFAGISRGTVLSDYGAAAVQWSGGFREHTTARADPAGYAVLQAVNDSDDGERGEAVLESSVLLVTELRERFPDASLGVLVRRNKTAAKIIYRLRQSGAGISASQEGGNPLTDSAPVCAVLAVLAFCDHPGDMIARYHAARSPLGKVLGFSDYSDDAVCWNLGAKLRREFVKRGFGPVIYEWVRELEKNVDARELRRLMQLVELGHAFDGAGWSRLDDFTDFIRSERVEDRRLSGVQVMTVHRAKGLEFDIVVLPELDVDLGRRNQPRFLVCREDRMSPPERVTRYVRDDLRKLHPAFEEMKRRQDDYEAVEFLSVLYVALTRPKKALYALIRPSAKNETRLPPSHAGVLREAFGFQDPVQPGSVLFETGDAGWRSLVLSEGVGDRKPLGRIVGQRKEKEEGGEIEREYVLKEKPSPPAVGVSSGAPTRRIPKRSASELEGGEAIELSFLFGVLTQDALVRGSCIHAFFQEVEWLDDGAPREEVLRQAAGRIFGMSADSSVLIARFFGMLRISAISELFFRSFYKAYDVDELEVFSELPFAELEGNELVNGSIDRLVVGRKGGRAVFAEVVDFKTDVLFGDEQRCLSEKTEYYRPQIGAYKEAASRIFNLPRNAVTGKLAFVSIGQVVTV